VGELIVCNDWRLAGEFVPAVVSAFHRKFPRAEVTLRDLRFHDQLAALRARRAHLGFVVRSVLGRATELDTMLVLRTRLMAVLPARHPRAGDQEVSLADLAEEKWVTLDEKEAPGYRAFMMQVARISGFTPHFGKSASTVEGLWGRVAMGYGVALTLENSAPHHNPMLRSLATDIEPLELCAVWHRREKSSLLHALLDIIREQVKGDADAKPARAPKRRVA
jgi:DNA-binding transcriptional LysR family regulator